MDAPDPIMVPIGFGLFQDKPLTPNRFYLQELADLTNRTTYRKPNQPYASILLFSIEYSRRALPSLPGMMIGFKQIQGQPVFVTGSPHPAGQLASYNLKPFNYSAVVPAYAIIIHHSRAQWPSVRDVPCSVAKITRRSSVTVSCEAEISPESPFPIFPNFSQKFPIFPKFPKFSQILEKKLGTIPKISEN